MFLPDVSAETETPRIITASRETRFLLPGEKIAWHVGVGGILSPEGATYLWSQVVPDTAENRCIQHRSPKLKRENST